MLLLVAVVGAGCQTSFSKLHLAYYKQPKLHNPQIGYDNLVFRTNGVFCEILSHTNINIYIESTTNTNAQIANKVTDTNAASAMAAPSQSDTTNATSEFRYETNVYQYLITIQGTNLTKYPYAKSLQLITNGGFVFPVADTVLEEDREYAQSTNGVKATFQVESDDDSAEEFGRTFASCFYVGQIDIHNSSTNYTFLADSSSLWVMTSFYLTQKDWESSHVLQNNIRRRFGQEFIRMPRNPLTYGDILAVFAYQEKANPKQQISDYLDSMGVIASGATIFIPGSLYSESVAFAVGIVKPEIQKHLLWDLVQYHANFMARSLPEIVKVSPNSGVDGVVFFPKRPIPGYVDGHEVYISSFNSKAETALISGAFVSQAEPVSSATDTTNGVAGPRVTGQKPVSETGISSSTSSNSVSGSEARK